MRDEIKVEHRGVEITYDEYADVWKFELRGRERSAKSLKNAKETIDKPEPKSKKPFTPVKAYYIQSHSTSVKAVEITSLAEESGRPKAWTKDKHGSREKVSLSDLYEVSAHNQELIGALRDEDKTLEEARSRQVAMRKKLKNIEVEVPEE